MAFFRAADPMHAELSNSYYYVTSETDGFFIEKGQLKNKNVIALGKGLWSEVSKNEGASIIFSACSIFHYDGDVRLIFSDNKDLKDVVKFIILHSTEADLFALVDQIAQMDDVAKSFPLFNSFIDDAVEKLKNSVNCGCGSVNNTLQKTNLTVAAGIHSRQVSHTATLEYEDGVKIIVALQNGDDAVDAIVFFIDSDDTANLAEHLIEGMCYAYNVSDAFDILNFISDVFALRFKAGKIAASLQQAKKRLGNSMQTCRDKCFSLL